MTHPVKFTKRDYEERIFEKVHVARIATLSDMVRGYENIKLDNVTGSAALREEAAIVVGHTQNDQEARFDGGQ